MSNLFDLSGTAAVITGSTKGIGRAIALRMAEHGAKITVSSRKADMVEQVTEEIRAAGGDAIGIPCNIADKDELQNLIDKSKEHWGRIDTLICNAAVNPFYGPLAEIEDRAFDRIMESNVRSNMWLSRMARPHLAEQGGGSIIIVSSIGGLKGSATLGAYAISKAADMQLARNLAVEWGGDNIRTNCIAPGLVKTDFARVLYEDPEKEKDTLKAYPIGRLGEPDDIAGGAVFLASAAGSWVTGQTIVMDGGTTIGARYS